MDDEHHAKTGRGVGDIVAENRRRLEQVMSEAGAAGGKWVVECRDMWDAHDADAGIYFVVCKRERDVDRIARSCGDDGMAERWLGAFDVARPLVEQWPGLERGEWQARRAAGRWRLPRKLAELFKR